MNRFIAGLTAAGAFAAIVAATPALAHGRIDCRSGPQSGWQPIEALTSQLVAQGWEIKKAHRERDCYEVYGKTPEGDNVESFFHPVTLEKILVLKRGRELFRAPGY